MLGAVASIPIKMLWDKYYHYLLFISKKTAVQRRSMTFSKSYSFAVAEVDFDIELTNVYNAHALPWVKAGMATFIAWFRERSERSNWPARWPRDEFRTLLECVQEKSWLSPDNDLGKIHKCNQYASMSRIRKISPLLFQHQGGVWGGEGCESV